MPAHFHHLQSGVDYASAAAAQAAADVNDTIIFRATSDTMYHADISLEFDKPLTWIGETHTPWIIHDGKFVKQDYTDQVFNFHNLHITSGYTTFGGAIINCAQADFATINFDRCYMNGIFRAPICIVHTASIKTINVTNCVLKSRGVCISFFQRGTMRVFNTILVSECTDNAHGGGYGSVDHAVLARLGSSHGITIDVANCIFMCPNDVPMFSDIDPLPDSVMTFKNCLSTQSLIGTDGGGNEILTPEQMGIYNALYKKVGSVYDYRVLSHLERPGALVSGRGVDITSLFSKDIDGTDRPPTPEGYAIGCTYGFNLIENADTPSPDKVLFTETTGGVQGKWQPANPNNYKQGETFGVDGTSETGTLQVKDITFTEEAERNTNPGNNNVIDGINYKILGNGYTGTLLVDSPPNAPVISLVGYTQDTVTLNVNGTESLRTYIQYRIKFNDWTSINEELSIIGSGQVEISGLDIHVNYEFRAITLSGSFFSFPSNSVGVILRGGHLPTPSPSNCDNMQKPNENYYYYNSVRSQVIVFMSLFKNMKVVDEATMHTDDTMTNIKETNIDIIYTPKERKLIDQTHESLIPSSMYDTKVPRFSVSISSINYDQTRVLNYYRKRRIKQFIDDDGNVSMARDRMPIPYDIGINLSILAKYEEHIHMISENIVPYIAPYIIVKIRENPKFLPLIPRELRIDFDGNVNRDIPISWGDTERRTVKTDLSFVIKGWIYKPLYKAPGPILNIPISIFKTIDFNKDDMELLSYTEVSGPNWNQ